MTEHETEHNWAEEDRERESDLVEKHGAPETLRIVVREDATDAFDSIRDRAARWDDGEEVPAEIGFEDPEDLRALLTPRRLEVIRSIMHDSPASVNALAERLDRGYREVYEDVERMAEYGIVHFERDGRAKRPYIPYEAIEYEGRITAQTGG